MPAKKRKSQRKARRVKEVKRYAGKSEKEWRDWGEEFGKGIDKGGRSLSEGMEKWNETFGKRMEKHGRGWETGWKSCCYGYLGIVGPLVASIAGIIFILIGIWLLDIINASVSNNFVFLLSNFLYTNIQWFLLASLLFGYYRYQSARSPRGRWLLSPIVNSLKVVFVIWILASIFYLTGIYAGPGTITMFSNFVLVSLPALFSILVLLGYVFEIVVKILFMGYKK